MRTGELLQSRRTTCLILEDEALIAMSLEAYLEDAGYEVAGPFCTPEQSLEWLKDATPDCAILDFRLKEGMCLDVVRELQKRGVPFVIYSGLPRDVTVPISLQDAPWLEKPLPRDEMLNILTGLLGHVAGPGNSQLHH